MRGGAEGVCDGKGPSDAFKGSVASSAEPLHAVCMGIHVYMLTVVDWFVILQQSGNLFEAFATTPTVGGRIVQPDDPIASTAALFENLDPGVQYLFRLVCTNPSGTTYGKVSKPFVTLPATPPGECFCSAFPMLWHAWHTRFHVCMNALYSCVWR